MESKCEESKLRSRFFRLAGEQSVAHIEELVEQTDTWQWMYTTSDRLDVNSNTLKLNLVSLAGDGSKCTNLTVGHLRINISLCNILERVYTGMNYIHIHIARNSCVCIDFSSNISLSYKH